VALALCAASLQGRGDCAQAAVAGALPAHAARPRVELVLAPDPEGHGPPALVFARAQLHRFGIDPRQSGAGLVLTIDQRGVSARLDTAPLPAAAYLTGTITTEAGGTVSFSCDAAGHETWRGAAAAFTGAPLREVLACTDLGRPIGKSVWLDVPVLVGSLATAAETGSPVGLLLTLGAAECGELIARADQDGDDLVVTGCSRGGLALPALLLVVARADAGDLGEEERWMALSFAARDSRRDEAALQLARFASPRTERCLLALLQSEDLTRGCALEALARRRACAALPAMVATPAFAAESDPVALAALATLWPTCSAEQRRAARIQLAANPMLLAAVDDLARPAIGPPLAGGASEDLPVWRRALLVGLVLTALALAWRVLGRSLAPLHRIS